MLTTLAGAFALQPKPFRHKTCSCNACVERRRLQALRRALVQSAADRKKPPII
jgi:hypothetical protein